jgi:AraC family transcriptional regulator
MLSDLLAHGHDIRSADLPRSPAHLHCMALGAGYEQRINEEYSWDGLKRGSSPFLVLQHTVLGEGRLDFAGTQYRLRPGQTMLVTMPHAHRYWLERGGRWEYFWLLLNGREALRLAREILAAAGPVIEVEPALADRMAGACLSLLTVERMTPGLASTAGYAAMAALHDGVFAERKEGQPLPPTLARVTDFVGQHLAEALPVDRLAAVAGTSRAHFVRQFTAATGQPPSDFVLERRLERAERLLLATELTVREIAGVTGFADGNYLAKVFRRERGMSPLEYRATRAEAG